MNTVNSSAKRGEKTRKTGMARLLELAATKKPLIILSAILSAMASVVSFAPYVAPPDVEMRPGTPYLVYYSARSRLLLSLFALDELRGRDL